MPARTPSAGPAKGARFAGRVEDLTAEGAGVVRLDGLVVFVPGAVPGDLVEGRLTRTRKGWAEGALARILEPAAARREPPCPHQPACGGCPLMVLDEATALSLKVSHLREVLRRIGRLEVPPIAAHPSPQALRYRSRVRFAVAPGGTGFGYRPRGDAGALVAIDDCLLVDPRATELARAFLGALAACAEAADPWPVQLELRVAAPSRRWLLVVYATTATPWPALQAAAGALVEREMDLAGVVLLGRHDPPSAVAGLGVLSERLAGFAVESGPTTFLQVNPGAAETLHALVDEALGGVAARETSLLDLYCGVGLHGLTASAGETELLGIELEPTAVEAARLAAMAAGRRHARYHAADVAEAVPQLVADGARFARVVVNPPRAGCAPGLAAALAALAPQRVAMVSCHPAALARDLRLLVDVGFALRTIEAVDMFPQTPHLEAVALLEGPA